MPKHEGKGSTLLCLGPTHLPFSLRTKFTAQVEKSSLASTDSTTSKGIPQKFRAFECLLQQHPEWIGKAVLVQFAAPSREVLKETSILLEELESIAEQVNQEFDMYRSSCWANLSRIFTTFTQSHSTNDSFPHLTRVLRLHAHTFPPPVPRLRHPTRLQHSRFYLPLPCRCFLEMILVPV